MKTPPPAHRRRLRAGLLAAGATVVALVASACGSSSTSSATAGSSSAPAASSSAPAASSSSAGAPQSSASAGTGTASKVLADAKTAKLVIGIKFDQPGLALKNPDGSFGGFDVEVAKYVAKQLGVEASGITFKESKSAEREGLIERGEVDFIVATYSITDTRKQKVDFAGPYFVAHQDLLVKADNTDITGPEAMKGKILCSVTGSTSAQKVKDKYAADVALQEYGTYAECVEALKTGVVDAVTTDDVILAGFAAQSPGEFKVVGSGFSDENYGIGLKKGDTAGTAAINSAIKKMIADGSWKKALESTVGPSGYKIPAAPTVG
ncbi:amino acid ABC transporter substrate-binding protein, PAAT family [Nakamurella panacisegetis]|uniref:Amino acid ABC transporter substrate-binding protein, PAAT family n=1 Tax=Nakamurella panacisegetis TaxID=1090615 RepID=A0A1H0Q6M8_9ACTN|nr:glutamate ABC transporter substrate-binding protein [Nakamurella panacisegetis]SDP12279.1 amino acid ABC transporter substrate-binding protein, PAAT family [Nakamurella panacisegetis]